MPLTELRATAEKLAEHEPGLGEIGEQSQGKCLWVALEPVQAGAG